MANAPLQGRYLSDDVLEKAFRRTTRDSQDNISNAELRFWLKKKA